MKRRPLKCPPRLTAFRWPIAERLFHEALEGQFAVDRGTSARKQRAAVNTRLGADELVKSLLRDADLDQWRNGGSDCESS